MGALLLLGACSISLSPPRGASIGAQIGGGHGRSLTNIATWKLSGEGPNGQTFSVGPISLATRIYQSKLTPGQWTIKAEGFDATESVYASASEIVTLTEGKTTKVALVLAHLNTPPQFAGLTGASATMTQATLTWNAATDAQTAANALVYDIWVSASDAVDTTAQPTATTAAGATSYTVTGLTPYLNTTFLVRARDTDGDRDSNTLITTVPMSNPQWQRVDGGGTYGLGTESYSGTTAAASVSGKLYAARFVKIEAGYEALYISEFNGDDDNPQWTRIDGGAEQGLNSEPNASWAQSMVGFQGKLYVGWSEWMEGEYRRPHVSCYSPDTATWEDVDSSGLMYWTGSQTDLGCYSTPRLVTDGSTLYAVWSQQDETRQWLRASRWENSTWVPLFDSTNELPAPHYGSASAAVYDGKLVLAWDEMFNNLVSARFSSWDGSTWQTITPPSLSSLPYMEFMEILVSGGDLYVTWMGLSGPQTEDETEVRTGVFRGGLQNANWLSLSPNPENDSALDYIEYPVLADLNGRPVLLFHEFLFSSDYGTKQQRAKVFNGDFANPQWQFIDAGAPGLTDEVPVNGYTLLGTGFGGKLYLFSTRGLDQPLTQMGTFVYRGL